MSYTDFSDVSCTSEDECWVSSSFVNEIYHTTYCGDGNGNGVPDKNEPDVASLPTSTGAGYMTVRVSGCNTISRVRSYQAERENIPFDSGFTHPYGLVGFEIPCALATVTIYYHDAQDLSGMNYRKYGPTPAGFGSSSWCTVPGVEFGADAAGAYARFTLRDGALGDDIPGDGRITDQGGPGSGRGAVAVPAMGHWGTLLLILTLAAVGILRAMRQVA